MLFFFFFMGGRNGTNPVTQNQRGGIDLLGLKCWGLFHHGFHRIEAKDLWIFSCYFYPLVNVYITMEKSTIFNGKIHYFYSHFQ